VAYRNVGAKGRWRSVTFAEARGSLRERVVRGARRVGTYPEDCLNRTTPLLLAGALLTAAACSDSSGPPVAKECSTKATPSAATTLAVGGVRVLAGADAIGCVILPTTSGAEYLFVVSNANGTLDDEKRFNFSARPDSTFATTAASVALSPALVPAASVASSFGSDGALTRELALRSYERAHLDPRASLLGSGASRATSNDGLAPRGALAASAIPAVGDTRPFRVPGTGDKPCDTYDSVTAVVKYVSQRAIIVQDLAAPANGFTDADFAAIANEFDSLIYPADVNYFGSLSEVDPDGHVYILFTPSINKLNPHNTTSGFFAGFFFAGDFYPRTGSSGQACKQSNGTEVFYLLVPDPNGQYGNVIAAANVRQLTRGTVAHEFQHMINAGSRFLRQTSAFEDVWLDEGLAHFAEEAVGRVARGFSDTQSLSYADVSLVSADYKAFFDQNLRRFALWLIHPDTSSGTSEHADENLSSRGAAWALVRYSADQYSGGDVRSFTRRLTFGPEVGVKNLTARTGVVFDSVLAGFMVANFADDTAITNLSARYSYPSWNMRDAVAKSGGGVAPPYPLRVSVIGSTGGAVTEETRTGSGTYTRYVGNASGTPVVVRVLDAAATSLATYGGARLYILRLK